MKMQFVDENRLIIWNAMESDHDSYTQITDSTLLSSILNILIWQRMPAPKDWI